jgi:hypothetical protein
MGQLMGPYNVRLIRDDAQQIYVYNDGPTIFFYDKKNLEIIKAANPSLLEGFYDDPEKDLDKPLLELGEQGRLVVLELFQDDEFQAELSLGQPLEITVEGKELWSQPQGAFLSLPSGQLCVESMNSSWLNEDLFDNGKPVDEGAYLTVAPGDYILSVQVLNRNYEQDDNNLIPEYYLTLVQISGGRGSFPNHPFIMYPREF